MTNKYFAYIRPKEGVSLDQQHRLIARYARRERLEITKWLTEKKRSALPPRPLFDRMLRDLKAGKMSGVVTDKRERFSRSLTEGMEIAELVSRGVDFHFAAN